jgi:hypothetical protein
MNAINARKADWSRDDHNDATADPAHFRAESLFSEYFSSSSPISRTT